MRDKLWFGKCFATKMLQKLVFATLAIVARHIPNHNLSGTRTVQGIIIQGSNAATRMGKPKIISGLEPTKLQFFPRN